MSTSKSIKKRTLPSVPKATIDSPSTIRALDRERNKETPARALFQGNNQRVLKKTNNTTPLSKMPSKTKQNTPVVPSPRLSKKKINQTPTSKAREPVKSTATPINKSRESVKSTATPISKSRESVKSTATPISKLKDSTESAAISSSAESNNDETAEITNNSNNQSNNNERNNELDDTDDFNRLQQRASLMLKAAPGTRLRTNYDNSSITVAVRLRPFSARELALNYQNVIAMNGNVTILNNLSGPNHEFAFDFSFWSFDSINRVSPFVSQEDVYNCVAKPLIDWSFEGYNTCLFAYGQTGSGKSYTVMGYEEEEAGIVPRFSKDLFEKIAFFEEEEAIRYSVEISFYEIYNEKIFDLLLFNDGSKQRLCVREHPDMGPYVQGLSKHIVGAHNDIQDWLEVGNKNRATAATGMNDKSSRSHSVFTIVLTQVKTERFEETETQVQKTSRINLIDLAGSERAKKVLEDNNYGKDVQNTRLKEGGCINKSLHTLGKVISILSDNQLNPKKKATFIPYRDSILTWLLKDSLGGNARTTMLATISPASAYYSETLSTLRYAQQARSIVNKAKINEDPKSKLIREMLSEIQRLKESQRKSGDFGHALENEVTSLRCKLKETQTALAGSTRSWQEKLESSEKKQKEAASHLRRSGVAFTKLEHHLPSLVNLNEDPQLAEVLLYILQEGKTYVGSKETSNAHDVQLRGNLVADQHCYFEYKEEIVAITSIGDAPTYVNGVLITDATIIHHGDRIVIGGDHFFRLNHPKEAAKLKEKVDDRRKSFKNFEFAKDELLKKQNERLEAELEEARLQAEADAMEQIKQAQMKAEEDMQEQRSFFEKQLDLLQKKLDDTTGKKKEAEEGNQSAQEIINQLREHQKLLEDEILANRKRLNMEALAAKQILEDTKSSHLRILSELEREKKQIEEDVKSMRNFKEHSNKMHSNNKLRSSILISVNQTNEEEGEHRDLLKISLMLREANKINQKLQQPYVFTRDDFCIDGKVDVRIRVYDKKNKKTTLISLARFEEELSHMQDLPQNDPEITLLYNDHYEWEENTCDEIPNSKSPRMSLSNQNSFSFISNINESMDMNARSQQYLKPDMSMNSTYVNDMSRMSTVSNIPVESTRLSSAHPSNLSVPTNNTLEISQMKSSLFESILHDEPHDDDVSVISRLITLLCSIYTDWNRVQTQQSILTNDGGDDPLLMLACNLKTLKDVASLLCSVHEAVGLDELKTMSYSFKKDVNQACEFVRNNVNSSKCDRTTEESSAFKQLIFQLIEISGAMSLAAVDHIKGDNNQSYFSLEKDCEKELFVYFLKQQNRFLVTMVTEALNTIQNGIENIKNLQLTFTHEMSDDLVDGVMNILTSATTLLERCKDLLVVYADISISRSGLYFAKECIILRKLLTAIVDYNENVYNLLEHSKNVAANCDTLDEFLDVPIELADTTKRICAAGNELTSFVSLKKGIDEETSCTFKDCFEKFEFAGKTVRVGVAIVIQEVEKDLNINEEQSIISFIQGDEPFSRETSSCPLNRTSLDLSLLNPHLQNKFKKNRKSTMQPDLFISRCLEDIFASISSESVTNELTTPSLRALSDHYLIHVS